jgi:hypothetical protein
MSPSYRLLAVLALLLVGLAAPVAAADPPAGDQAAPPGQARKAETPAASPGNGQGNGQGNPPDQGTTQDKTAKQPAPTPTPTPAPTDEHPCSSVGTRATVSGACTVVHLFSAHSHDDFRSLCLI